MAEKKYGYTFSELVDRLVIVQLKQIYNPELKDVYAEEIANLVHDIQLCLPPDITGMAIRAETIRHMIVLAIMNHIIYINEDDARKAEEDIIDENLSLEERYQLLEEKYMRLVLTHSLNNGGRNVAKKKIQSNLGGRYEYKNMTLNGTHAKQWLPDGY